MRKAPRQRRRQARVREILVTAMRLAEARGLDGLTLHDIAAELDYTVAALYRYFPSKAALVTELQRRVVSVLDARIAALHARCAELESAAGARGALLPLVATASFYGQAAETSPAAFGLLSLSLGDPRHLLDDAQAGRVLATARPIFDRLAADLAAAVRAGALASGEPVDRAVVFWAALHGVVQLRKLRRLAPGLLETRRLAPELVRTLLIGWGAAAGLVDGALREVARTGIGRLSVVAEDLEAAGEVPDAAPDGEGAISVPPSLGRRRRREWPR